MFWALFSLVAGMVFAILYRYFAKLKGFPVLTSLFLISLLVSMGEFWAEIAKTEAVDGAYHGLLYLVPLLCPLVGFMIGALMTRVFPDRFPRHHHRTQ